MELTKDKVKDIITQMKVRDAEIKPRMIMTQKEADWLTGIDITGKQWKLGEEYFVAFSKVLGNFVCVEGR